METVKFLKNFGLGLVYIILLPLLLAGVVLFGVYSLGLYIVGSVKIIIRFFSGKPGFEPLEEDEKVEAIKKAYANKELEKMEEKKPDPQPQPQNVYVQQNYYTGLPKDPNQAPDPKAFSNLQSPFYNPQGIPQSQNSPAIEAEAHLSPTQIETKKDENAPQKAPIAIDISSSDEGGTDNL